MRKHDGKGPIAAAIVKCSLRITLWAIGDLLAEEVAAVADPTIQSYGCEIRAPSALGVCPFRDARNERTCKAPQHVQQAVIEGHDANVLAVVATVGAKTRELDQTIEIARRDVFGCQSRNFADVPGKFNPPAVRQDRTAMQYEELQQCRHRDDENQCCNHRALARRLPAASRASSGIFVNVYAQAAGNHKPRMGNRKRKTGK